MKHCPTCNRDYPDDSLSFCLDDGSPLASVGGGGGYDPNATLTYNTGRPTDPAPSSGFGSGGYPPPASGGWDSQKPAYGPPPRRSNAVWWVLGIGGVLVVAGIGVLLLIGVIGFASLSGGSGNRNSASTPKKNPIATVNDDGRKLVFSDDFSEQKWMVNSSELGSASYVAGMYQLTGAPDRYFVSRGPTDDYRTDENTTVKVTVRSISGQSTSYGYGVAVFNNIAGGQANDYSFLINTGDDPAFTVKLHQNGAPTSVKEFTRSSLIRSGATPNLLEVKITREQLTFYINGQFATSVTNAAGFTDGRVGLCLHDSYPIAFDDLEIYR